MGAPPEAASELITDDTDLLYEEDILRNAFSLKYWTRYLEAKRRAPARQRNRIAERALKYLPGSYKIWRGYLNDRRAQVKHHEPGDPALEAVSRTYERALAIFEARKLLLERMVLEYGLNVLHLDADSVCGARTQRHGGLRAQPR